MGKCVKASIHENGCFDQCGCLCPFFRESHKPLKLLFVPLSLIRRKPEVLMNRVPLFTVPKYHYFSQRSHDRCVSPR